MSAYEASMDGHESLTQVVVRIEVHDTGVELRARDLADSKLLSPYVQVRVFD